MNERVRCTKLSTHDSITKVIGHTFAADCTIQKVSDVTVITYSCFSNRETITKMTKVHSECIIASIAFEIQKIKGKLYFLLTSVRTHMLYTPHEK